MLLKEQSLENLFPEMQRFSKIWIYQSDRFLEANEIELITSKATAFVSGWDSHGSKLKADFVLLHNLFLVFVVDETVHEASGCSIDRSVHFVKAIEKEVGTNFFNRTLTAYFKEDGSITFAPLNAMKRLIASGEITKETLIFSNLVQDLEGFKANWMMPVKDTWVARLF